MVRIRKTDALRRLIDQLAVRTSLELNIAELCELIGVQRHTTEQYPDVLHHCHIVNIRGNSYRMRAHQDLFRPAPEDRREGVAK